MRNFRQKHRYFIAGLLFVILNLGFILMQTVPLNSTRLGDDSLAYLLKKVKIDTRYSVETPTMQDLYRYEHHVNPHQTADTQWWKDRSFMRMRSTISPIFDLWIWGVWQVGFSLKWTWFLVELSVIGLLAWAIVSLQKRIAPTNFPEIALVAIALTTFPNQGIHFFIASVAALSLSMLLLSLCLRPEPPKVSVFFLTAFLLLGMHKVGQVHGAMAGMLVLWQWYRTRNRRYLGFAFSLILSLMFFAAVDFLLGNFSNTGGQGGIAKNLSEIGENILGMVYLVGDCIRASPHLVWIFALFFGGLFFSDLRGQLRSSKSVLVLLVGAMLAGACFYLPTYPAELMARFFTFFGIVLCLIAGGFWNRIENKPTMLVLGLMLTVLMAISLKHKVVYAYENINRRNLSADERLYRKDFERAFSTKDPAVIFCETDITMGIHVLSEGERNRVIPYPMFRNDPMLGELMTQNTDRVVVVPQPRFLNFLSDRQEHTVQYRNNGFPFYGPQIMVLNVPSDRNLDVRVEGGPYRMTNDRGESQTIPFSASPAWHRIEVRGDRLKMEGARGWLLGISLDGPNDSVYWPWNQSVALEYQMPDLRPMHFSFSIQKTMEEMNCAELIPWIDFSRLKMISDRSGILLFSDVFRDIPK